MMVEMIKNPQSLVNAAIESELADLGLNPNPVGGFNASLKNDGPKAKNKNGEPITNLDAKDQNLGVSTSSLSNDTKQLNTGLVSVGNNISINLGSIFSTSSSLSNDDGKDVTSPTDPLQNPQISLANDTQPYSTTPSTGGGGAGGGAVGAPPSVGEVYLGSVSLSNDDGKDSSYVLPGNPQASLSNDDGPDAN